VPDRSLTAKLYGEDKTLGKTFDKVGGKSEVAAKKFDLMGAASKKLAGAAVAGAVVKFGFDSVRASSNTTESVSKMNTVFGKSAGEVGKFVREADKIGLSDRAAADATGTFGNLFTQLKIGTPEAAKMSTAMTGLAADFASFHNADITEVIQAQTAAFRGEYDALQRFVPTINAAAVQTEAMRVTGKKNAQALTDQEKATATYTLMMQGAGKARGDFARTADGAANKERILAARFEDTQAKLGNLLIPAYTKGVDVLTDFTSVVGGVADAAAKIPAPITDGAMAFAKFAGGALLAQKALGAAGTAVTGFAVKKLAIDFTGLNLAQGYTVKSTGMLKGALGGLAGQINPVTAGLVGLSAVMAIGAAQAEAHRQKVEGLSQALAAGGDVAAEAEAKLADMQAKADRIRARTGEGRKLSRQEAAKTADRIEKEIRKIRTATRGLIEDEGAATKAQNELSAAQRTYADLLATGTASEQELAAAREAVAAAGGKVKDITDKVSAATAGQAKKVETLTEKLKAQRQATLDLVDANLDALDAARALERGQDELNDVQAEARAKAAALADAQRKFGKSSRQAKAAAEELSDANRDLTDKMIDQARRAGELAQKNYKGKDASIAAERGALAQKAVLEKLARHAVPEVREALRKYIEELGKIPAKKPTRVTLDDRQALLDLSKFKRELHGIPDERVNVIVRYPNGRPHKASERAAGGPVTKGRPYVVGEHRPELFVPDQDGTILPEVPPSSAGPTSGGRSAFAAFAPAADDGLARLLTAQLHELRELRRLISRPAAVQLDGRTVGVLSRQAGQASNSRMRGG